MNFQNTSRRQDSLDLVVRKIEWVASVQDVAQSTQALPLLLGRQTLQCSGMVALILGVQNKDIEVLEL
jgi:hypothetical protein